MIANAFAGHAAPPSHEELASALGASLALWTQLTADLVSEFALAVDDWHSYSREAGWSLRVKQRDRNIVYLSPGEGAFMASFALGERAMAAARAGKLPKSALAVLDAARRYAEGTAVRIDVKKAAGLAVVKRLVAAKMAG
jgi:hypothetical protein